MMEETISRCRDCKYYNGNGRFAVCVNDTSKKYGHTIPGVMPLCREFIGKRNG